MKIARKNARFGRFFVLFFTAEFLNGNGGKNNNSDDYENNQHADSHVGKHFHDSAGIEIQNLKIVFELIQILKAGL